MEYGNVDDLKYDFCCIKCGYLTDCESCFELHKKTHKIGAKNE